MASEPQRVWFYHPEDAWSLGVISGTGAKNLIVMADNGQDEYPVKQNQIHAALHGNPEIVDDLLKLSELHEATLLHNVRERFKSDKVYTFVGPIVIAVNPFKRLPLYGDDQVKLYRKSGLENNLPPHVFNIADVSYDKMLVNNRSQSVLISGESGAGKTETTKYLMKFLGDTAGVKKVGETNIQNQIMQANPILEAFGNAKTLRNNNSSRFGKFIKIQFDQGGFLNGAQITNYLLERSRVVKQTTGERNYHVFYQLLAGADSALKTQLSLDFPQNFYYLRQSGTYSLGEEDDEDEAQNFKNLLEAFRVVGMNETEVQGILKVVAGILHLGNVNFVLEKSKTWHTAKVENGDVLRLAAMHLGVDPEKMEFNLTNRRNLIKGEYFVVALDESKALDNRDSLAKTLYGQCFNWLVERINGTLEGDSSSLFIGLLDIFGFEHFKVNSFEQFCINFANEKLQQHYNRHTFKWEQEACQAEDIDYTKIDFVDNQICLDLIEKKPLGIISLLDEESNFPKATNESLLQKLITNHTSHLHFEKPKLSRTAFVVRHYAGAVSYEVAGFLEKNKDSLPEDLAELVQSSSNSFIASLLAKSNNAKKKAASVGSEFRNQLDDLMKLINSTDPHWIRCIKPNSLKKPNLFNGPEVITQLNCAGVLETIRIRRSGYPVRMPVEDFYKRFKMMYPKIKMEDGKSARSAVAAMLQQLKLDTKDCQLGLTKVFLRAEQHEKLEELRTQMLHVPAGTIQRVVRGWLGRIFVKKTKAARKIQKVVRGFLAQQKYKENKKKITIAQAVFRMRRQRSVFISMIERRRAEEALEEANESENKNYENASVQKKPVPLPPNARNRGVTAPRANPAPVDTNMGMLYVLAALTGLSPASDSLSFEKIEAMEHTLEAALNHVRSLKQNLQRTAGVEPTVVSAPSLPPSTSSAPEVNQTQPKEEEEQKEGKDENEKEENEEENGPPLVRELKKVLSKSTGNKITESASMNSLSKEEGGPVNAAQLAMKSRGLAKSTSSPNSPSTSPKNTLKPSSSQSNTGNNSPSTSPKVQLKSSSSQSNSPSPLRKSAEGREEGKGEDSPKPVHNAVRQLSSSSLLKSNSIGSQPKPPGSPSFQRNLKTSSEPALPPSTPPPSRPPPPNERPPPPPGAAPSSPSPAERPAPLSRNPSSTSSAEPLDNEEEIAPPKKTMVHSVSGGKMTAIGKSLPSGFGEFKSSHTSDLTPPTLSETSETTFTSNSLSRANSVKNLKQLASLPPPPPSMVKSDSAISRLPLPPSEDETGPPPPPLGRPPSGTELSFGTPPPPPPHSMAKSDSAISKLPLPPAEDEAGPPPPPLGRPPSGTKISFGAPPPPPASHSMLKSDSAISRLPLPPADDEFPPPPPLGRPPSGTELSFGAPPPPPAPYMDDLEVPPPPPFE